MPIKKSYSTNDQTKTPAFLMILKSSFCNLISRVIYFNYHFIPKHPVVVPD